MWNLVRGADLVDGERTWCPLPVPNFTFIGLTCRPCGAKNPFLDHWVKTIPAWLRYAQACPVGNGKTSHFFVYSRHATHNPQHSWHGDRGGPDHFCIPLTFFDPTSSFAARGDWKFEGKCPHRGENAYIFRRIYRGGRTSARPLNSANIRPNAEIWPVDFRENH